MPSTTPPTATPDNEALLEQTRNEAQEKIAELHQEEGTVRSEGAQNSPSPDDVVPDQRVDPV